jgi:HK97 family phage major capsid protein
MNAPIYREEFNSFEQFLRAVVAAGVHQGQPTDPRLRFAAPAGANEIIPSEGGFAVVPNDFAMDLLQRVENAATLYPLVDRQPISKGNTLKMPTVDQRSRAAGSRFGGFQLYRTGEGESASAFVPKFRAVELSLHKIMGTAYTTSEMFEDVPALAAILSRFFGLEAAAVVDDEIVNGWGGGGQMLGLLQSEALIRVEPESGQAAASVRVENITKMWARAWPGGLKRSVWLHNQELGPQLFALAEAGLVTFGDDGPRMLGRPLVAHESAKVPGAVGDLMLLDLSQYLIGERPQEFGSSLHVKFLQHEMVFRFVWRVAGAPGWSSAIAPLNGTATVSPYVALGERP